MHRPEGHRRLVWTLLGVGLLLAWACGGGGDRATTQLRGTNEVPPNNSPATGTASSTLSGDELSVEGSFSGLQSNLLPASGSAAHVHQADAGSNGPIVFNLTVDAGTDMRSGTLSGRGTLSPEQRRAYLDGQMYVNVHSLDAGMGEIRGQLIPGQ